MRWRSTCRRTALPAAVAVLLLATLASTSSAADLIALDGDPAVSLSGVVTYDRVYIDTTVGLVGHTQLNADTVYFGPHAQISGCATPGPDGPVANTCVDGRSLAITAKRTIAISGAVSLVGGSNSVARAGGELVLRGTDISIDGAITTTGTAAPSGRVSIVGSGRVSLRSITTASAPIVISGATGVTVTGDVVTTASVQQPAAVPGARYADGGPITVTSEKGDVSIGGLVSTLGTVATNGPAGGGNGGAVIVKGRDVSVGAIDTSGGTALGGAPGGDGPAGAPGDVSIDAAGDLIVRGAIDGAGSNGTALKPSAGAHVRLAATGRVGVGPVGVGGGSSAAGGAPGGQLEIRGTGVAVGMINAVGGGMQNGGAAGLAGGAGGTVSIVGTGNVQAADVLVNGGTAPAGSSGGAGGAVTIDGRQVTAGDVTAAGALTGFGGARGGAVRLLALEDLAVGAVSTSGSGAAGGVDPGLPGGAAGAIVMRALTGSLRAGEVTAVGGTGGGPVAGTGGPGGKGGAVDVVADTVSTVAAFDLRGGAGGGAGDTQGPGGDGGQLTVWGDAAVTDGSVFVDTSGGTGRPNGASPNPIRQQSPTDLAIGADGRATIASRSPGATAYRLLVSVRGGAPQQVWQGATTSGIALPAAPVCVPLAYTAVAVADAVGWVSKPTAPVARQLQPPGSQKCTQAPGIKTAKRYARRVRTLRRAKFVVGIRVRSSGAGTLVLVIKRGSRQARQSGIVLTRGSQIVRMKVPVWARKPGRYRVSLIALAPVGSARQRATTMLEVKR